MNIAFVGQKGIPSVSGGVEKHVEELAVQLAAAGHDVSVYSRASYDDGATSSYRGVSIIRLPSIATKNLDAITSTFLACLDLMRREVDIIHFHSIGPSSLIPLMRLLKPSARIVSTIHSQDYCQDKWGWFARTYLKIGERIASKFAHRTIVISHSLDSYVRRRYDAEPTYIPNGVSESIFLEPSLITSEFGLKKNSYILAVSRLIPNKGLHHLVAAYNGLETDKKLVIVGDSAFTDEYAQLIMSMAESNPNIIFTGRRSGAILSELFTNAALFVHPSELEGLSIAILEAMAHGKAVLASDIPENIEALKGAGFLFKNKDKRDLREKLAILLADPVSCAEVGRRGQQRVVSEHAWLAIGASTEQLYREALATRSVRRSAWELMAARFATFL